MTPVDIHAELWRAHRFARGLPPPLALAFAEQGFTRHDGRRFAFPVQWGFARVSFYGREGRRYEPADDGKVLAFIVPVVEDSEVVDLCAIDPDSQHLGTRLGYGRALGLGEIERARFGFELIVHERPLQWLRAPLHAAYLFNLYDAERLLAGVEEITCLDTDFGRRLRGLFPPSQRDRVGARV